MEEKEEEGETYFKYHTEWLHECLYDFVLTFYEEGERTYGY